MGIDIDRTSVIICCSVFGTGSDSKTQSHLTTKSMGATIRYAKQIRTVYNRRLDRFRGGRRMGIPCEILVAHVAVATAEK